MKPSCVPFLLTAVLVSLPAVRAADEFHLAEVTTRAEAGDAEAMFAVGRAYSKGEGAPLDPAKGAGFFRKAADAGHTKALTNLGAMYVEGRGVGKDYAEALKWFHQAAEQGDTSAMQNLGWMSEP